MTGDFEFAINPFQFGESYFDRGETGRGHDSDRRPRSRQEIDVWHIIAVVVIHPALLLFIVDGYLRLRHASEDFFRFIDPRFAVVDEEINFLIRPRPEADIAYGYERASVRVSEKSYFGVAFLRAFYAKVAVFYIADFYRRVAFLRAAAHREIAIRHEQVMIEDIARLPLKTVCDPGDK